MTSQCLSRVAPPPLPKRSSWWDKVAQLIATWHARVQAHSARHIDAWFRREREARERYLARAADRYELERMERDWERRHRDVWRVY